MKKMLIGVLSLLVAVVFLIGCAPKEDAEAVAGQAIRPGAPVAKACVDGQKCGFITEAQLEQKFFITEAQLEQKFFITEAQLEQKLNDFAKKIDNKSVSGAVFGDSAQCICMNPSSVSIQCQNDNWKNTVNFSKYRFEKTGDLQSAQSANGAICVGSTNHMVPETSFMQCDSFSNEDCDNFCESQLSEAEITEIEDDLNNCVSYFTYQCNGTVTVDGAYGDQANTGYGGWWTVYGVCRGGPEEDLFFN